MYILIHLLMNQGYLKLFFSAISLSTEYSTTFKIRLQQFFHRIKCKRTIFRIHIFHTIYFFQLDLNNPSVINLFFIS